MEALEILIPLTFFAMIAAIVIAPRYLKSLERQKMAETLRAAIERGQPLPPEMINVLTADVKPPSSPQKDLRRGVILVAVALGLVALGLVLGIDEPDATYPLIGSAAIPGFIGLALIVISRWGKDRS
jgi:hypothetical protein